MFLTRSNSKILISKLKNPAESGTLLSFVIVTGITSERTQYYRCVNSRNNQTMPKN